MISCGARLAPFDIQELREIMSYDEMELDMIGDQRTAMFVIISDTDDTFNFVVAIMYTQLFNLLCDKADDEHGGRLPYHVRLLLDEFSNIGQIPKFDKLIATIRSREISASIILQSQSQLKTIYKDAAETITGNCDTVLFLGGKESSTLKEISETLGSDRVLAYAIELTGKERGKIKGNLYELDYSKHYERVKEKELPADTVKLIYEHGERVQEAGRYFDGTPDPQLGKFERFEAVPNDPDALQSLLQEERRSREQLSPGDFKAHIAALRDGLIETEARRIVREMKRHYEPNSPNKTHFMAELSPAFMRLAATKDTDRLFSMLPYKTLSFSKIEGRHGTYALIDKGENRDREIRKPRPSIRAQLKADKAKTAPKKAAAKTKNHDMEV